MEGSWAQADIRRVPGPALLTEGKRDALLVFSSHSFSKSSGLRTSRSLEGRWMDGWMDGFTSSQNTVSVVTII